jgi:restriction endonuclease S subunit
MSKNNENKLVPRLRFPEFLKEGNWEDKILKQVSDVTSGQSPSGESYNEEGIGTPFYQGKTDFGDIFLKEPTKWTTEPTKFANADEILMSVRAPVGALNISTQKICIGRGLAAIQPKVNKWFLYYFLSRIKDRIIGNGGSVFDSINKEQIEKISVLIPQEQKEQQKIAACLSSLDDVITAESKKLEVLKEHKKGLLQNLFPQEGETVPKLRFKEFEDSGEWVEYPINSIGEVVTGGTPSKEENEYWGGDFCLGYSTRL